jgi:hypothetical protein
MERRGTDRKSLDISVVVTCPRVGLFRGRTRNISPVGMYVESPCVVMPIHAPVQVSIQSDPDDASRSLVVSGMVVHQRGNTFGLMFDDLDPAIIKALRNLMTNAEVPFAANL